MKAVERAGGRTGGGKKRGLAAALAIRNETSVQEIDFKALQEKILKAGIPLEVPDIELIHPEAPKNCPSLD